MKKPWKFYVGGDKSATVFDLSVDATHAASVLIENPDDDDENNVNDLVAFEDAAGEAYCCAGMEDGSVVIWSVADSFILDENGERCAASLLCLSLFFSVSLFFSASLFFSVSLFALD